MLCFQPALVVVNSHREGYVNTRRLDVFPLESQGLLWPCIYRMIFDHMKTTRQMRKKCRFEIVPIQSQALLRPCIHSKLSTVSRMPVKY